MVAEDWRKSARKSMAKVVENAEEVAIKAGGGSRGYLLQRGRKQGTGEETGRCPYARTGHITSAPAHPPNSDGYELFYPRARFID